MPELPEVETVRRGLEPVLVGNAFARVEQRRPDLRFPLPKRFAERLTGRAIKGLERRAKYLLARLDDGQVLIMHLGMTGRFAIEKAGGETSAPGDFVHEPSSEFGFPKHEHIVFHLGDGSTVRYSDVRRFGIMDLVGEGELDGHALFKGLGIEPLDEELTPAWLAKKLKGKTTPIKAALLDQRLIAGLGNIYVCEALFRARISPTRRAGSLATKTGRPTEKTAALVKGVQSVLREAIRSGGSSLRDYRHADGSLGRFQHRFRVYGRAGERCLQRGCDGIIQRIAQGGRSTFYCPICQR
ncbi:MAG: bifunctional DNA-formamidopyrimidine glycosylase/DNA-(apurinic or apyrimidinic site) lyase [Methyloceanibacter sp.]|nr:bifunctional DNA-formamidopyrimidine glycosylase/DNA-(apurinic or apyrimidinic site) lyase [Methyloceanibacter sp.]